jgi:hypothetical protein
LHGDVVDGEEQEAGGPVDEGDDRHEDPEVANLCHTFYKIIFCSESV